MITTMHRTPDDRVDAASYIMDFEQIGLRDLGRVGGKNASLGELLRAMKPKGVSVLDGFATTASAYRRLLHERRLEARLAEIFAPFDVANVQELADRGEAARAAVLETPLPNELSDAIVAAYGRLCARLGRKPEVAVRSSATARDLPEASFAGAAETFLNVRGRDGLLRAVHACFSSLFTDRAISYRARLGYDHLAVALSVGVQPMVRSDKASAGVMLTLDTESGFRDVVAVSGSWGLGEFVVQGVVTPDEWTVFKPTLATGHRAIVGRRLGSKEVRLVYGDGSKGTKSKQVPAADRARYCLADDEVLLLSRWACMIEKHYSSVAGHPQAMEMEWAKDGLSGELYVVQARPETVHSARPRDAAAAVHRLSARPPSPLVVGRAVGERIGVGRVRVVREPGGLGRVQSGEVLVAPTTDPYWEPVMRRVSAIVVERDGRTAHAATVARELRLPCIVGAEGATQLLQDGGEVTVCCAEGDEGRVYPGRLRFEVDRIDASRIPATHTRVMLTVGDPARAFSHATIPNAGVGLARLELIITNHIGIHPMAIVRHPGLADARAVKEIARRIGEETPREFFLSRLSEGIARIAAAFFPKPVIVRMSDFKSNQYAQLVGGREFEPAEQNPMLGFRGASRYDDPRYADGFALECEALARVREDMGLDNVMVMIPFCRTVDEARRVIAAMADHGLQQGRAGLEVWATCEVPSNVLLADEFLQIFDGYSIGSNELTQLTLGIDWDSETVAPLFEERNDAVRRMIRAAIAAARRHGKPIGICGRAPSDSPEFAEWLVGEGIDSISLDPDVAIATTLRIAEAESKLSRKKKRSE